MFDVERPAVVLGSGQRDDVLDAAACAAAGVEVVRRRSGGGAVLLEPGAVVWFDVIAPIEQLRAVGVADDVAASMRWLGEHIVTALRDLGVPDVAAHQGGMVRTPWSGQVCFAGLGPGEIVVDGRTPAPRKLVGISQRRTRVGARFQCCVHAIWSPGALVALLAPPRPEPGDLPPVATLPPDVAAALPAQVAAVVAA